MTYYEIVNTVNERETQVSARWSTEEGAKKDMKNYSDWWGPRGSGTIYEVTAKAEADGSVSINRREVGYCKGNGVFMYF